MTFRSVADRGFGRGLEEAEERVGRGAGEGVTAAGIYGFRQLQLGPATESSTVGLSVQTPLLPVLYGSGRPFHESGSVMKSFQEGLGKGNSQAVRTAFGRAVRTA